MSLRLCRKCSRSSRKTFRSEPKERRCWQGKGRQPFSLPSAQRSRRALARRLCATFLAHRIAIHFDAMSVVNQAIQNAVGGNRIADLFMPAGDRKLRSQDRRASLVSGNWALGRVIFRRNDVATDAGP